MENTQPMGTEPQVQSVTPTEAPSGLPSDVATNTPNLEGFTLTEEFIASNFKDGKLKGRFNSVEEVLEKLKEAEDFKANAIREKTQAEKDREAQTQTKQQQQELAQKQQETITSLLPQFLENNMQLTPEIESAATEAGIDIRDLKLGALEIRERLQNAHAVVGGAEEYTAMMGWAKEALTDQQKAMFDKDIVTDASEFAIEGLHARYRKAISEGHNPTRIEGDGAPRSLHGYANRQELYRDKDYINSPKGRNDVQAKRNYEARLKITPPEVLGLR